MPSSQGFFFFFLTQMLEISVDCCILSNHLSGFRKLLVFSLMSSGRSLHGIRCLGCDRESVQLSEVGGVQFFRTKEYTSFALSLIHLTFIWHITLFWIAYSKDLAKLTHLISQSSCLRTFDFLFQCHFHNSCLEYNMQNLVHLVNINLICHC